MPPRVRPFIPRNRPNRNPKNRQRRPRPIRPLPTRVQRRPRNSGKQHRMKAVHSTSHTTRNLAALFALGATCLFAQATVPGAGYSGSGYTPSAMPSGSMPASLDGVGVDEHLGRVIDTDLTFNDETGQPVNLKTFFNQGKPVLLDLVYYNCPQLCTLILNGQVEMMKDLPSNPGDKFEVVTVSIDPREDYKVAASKKATMLAAYGKPAPGWHFLTDRDGNAKKLAEQIGFHYRYDPRIEQYAHASAIMILSPSAKISRYLYGIKFRSFDVRFALAEASE